MTNELDSSMIGLLEFDLLVKRLDNDARIEGNHLVGPDLLGLSAGGHGVEYQTAHVAESQNAGLIPAGDHRADRVKRLVCIAGAEHTHGRAEALRLKCRRA